MSAASVSFGFLRFRRLGRIRNFIVLLDAQGNALVDQDGNILGYEA